MVVELSSAWLVRVSDEPGLGTTDYCCTFTANGRKKDGARPAEPLYSAAKSRERSCVSSRDVAFIVKVSCFQSFIINQQWYRSILIIY